MRYLIVIAVIILAGCSGAASSSSMPKVGFIFTENNPYAVMCPTREMELQLTQAANTKDASKVGAMLLGQGGICVPSKYFHGAAFEVVQIDEVNGFVGIRLADSPNGGTMWIIPRFVTSSSSSTPAAN